MLFWKETLPAWGDGNSDDRTDFWPGNERGVSYVVSYCFYPYGGGVDAPYLIPTFCFPFYFWNFYMHQGAVSVAQTLISPQFDAIWIAYFRISEWTQFFDVILGVGCDSDLRPKMAVEEEEPSDCRKYNSVSFAPLAFVTLKSHHTTSKKDPCPSIWTHHP